MPNNDFANLVIEIEMEALAKGKFYINHIILTVFQ